MIEPEWLLFLAQLPVTPSSLRVSVWRRLRDAGSTTFLNGVWILPRNPEHTIFMERLLAYVMENEASGQIFLAQGLNQSIHEDMLTRFKADRDQEYEEFLEQCEAFIAELEKEIPRGNHRFPKLPSKASGLHPPGLCPGRD